MVLLFVLMLLTNHFLLNHFMPTLEESAFLSVSLSVPYFFGYKTGFPPPPTPTKMIQITLEISLMKILL